jgi:B12-binding domain/radical SAM domain protein
MRTTREDIDLLLLHPPSVYDFREHAILYGPVSDLIPSSTVFEMYPLGFLTMAAYLQERGMRVRIVNLALRLINDRSFDARRFLARLRPRAVGIDLHWMPHCHGALELASLVKEVHPETPVILGGLSSSYYHEELLRIPQVDFVLRGDSVEPPLHELLTALQDGASLESIPNLTWRDDFRTRVNGQEFIPESLDYVDIRPDLMVEMALRYRDLQSVVPFNGWLKNPITAVFTVKGCSYECVTCGSSKTACTHVTQRKRPAYRSPASLVENMKAISRLLKGPIFLVGDLLQPGEEYAREVLHRLSVADIQNIIVFEFFTVPPDWFITEVDRSVRHWSVEFSPESHEEAIRDAQEGETGYSNEDMEAFFQHALQLGCSRIDVFFMIGLPAQTAESVHGTIDYCAELLHQHDERLSCFISPMGPFSDPGSRCFEEPERYGYRHFAEDLEAHRQLLVQPTWEKILNYETRWMTRKQIVDVTYDAAERLNELKMQFGRISNRRGRAVRKQIQEARNLRSRLDDEVAKGDGHTVPEELKGEIRRFSSNTVCDKQELFWQRHFMNFKLGEVFRIAGRYLLEPVC